MIPVLALATLAMILLIGLFPVESLLSAPNHLTRFQVSTRGRLKGPHRQPQSPPLAYKNNRSISTSFLCRHHTSLKAHAQVQVQGLREILRTKGFSGILQMKGPLPKFPPLAYLLTLLAAGFGFPVSEDLLVVYATVREYKSVNTVRKAFLFACVWMGVVGSDLVTYFIGSIIRRTYDFGPVSDSGLGLAGSSSAAPLSPPLTPSSKPLTPKSRLPSFLRKLPPLPGPLKRLLNSPFVGFYVRLMFGFRGPMMLWAGFERIGPLKFLIGSSVGALGSIGIQGAMGLSILKRLK